MKEETRGLSFGPISRISWGSVLAGTVVALVVELTLIMLGLAVGFATFGPAAEENALGTLGIGSAIWWIVSSIIALFVGGWTASRLAGIQRSLEGTLHGVVTWGVVILLSVYFISSALGSIIGGGFGVIGSSLSGSGQSVEQKADTAGREARELASKAESAVQGTDPQARQEAEDVAGRISKASLASFIMLVLTGAAAAIGGSMGRPKGPGEVISYPKQKAA